MSPKQGPEDGDVYGGRFYQVFRGLLAKAIRFRLPFLAGMAPLSQDVFWVSLSVAIMFRLAFGTVLTMIVVPVLHATFDASIASK